MHGACLSIEMAVSAKWMVITNIKVNAMMSEFLKHQSKLCEKNTKSLF